MVLQRMPEKYALVALSDVDSTRCHDAATTFNCRVADSFEQLVADTEVELLVIASPSHLHKDQAIAALENGKHVICEKPMATTLADADLMIACAARSDRLLTVFHTHHFAEDFKKVREICTSGLLGDLIHIKVRWNTFARRWDWQTLEKFGGGSLNNTGAHALEQALHFFGDDEPAVYCEMKQTISAGDAEDHVKIVLSHPMWPTVDLEITAVCAYPGPKWSAWGTRGGLTGSVHEIRWRYFLEGALAERIAQEQTSPDRSYDREDIPWQPETVFVLENNLGDLAGAFYQSFHASLCQGLPLEIGPSHARRVMALLQKCRRANQIHARVACCPK